MSSSSSRSGGSINTLRRPASRQADTKFIWTGRGAGPCAGASRWTSTAQGAPGSPGGSIGRFCKASASSALARALHYLESGAVWLTPATHTGKQAGHYGQQRRQPQVSRVRRRVRRLCDGRRARRRFSICPRGRALRHRGRFAAGCLAPRPRPDSTTPHGRRCSAHAGAQSSPTPAPRACRSGSASVAGSARGAERRRGSEGDDCRVRDPHPAEVLLGRATLRN